MKMLIGFLIVCNSYAMQNNPLINGVPSHYAPQMIKAITKKDKNEIIRLYKLYPNLIDVLQKKVEENAWIHSVFNDIKKIEGERFRKYKDQQEDDFSFNNLQHGKFEINKGTIPVQTVQTQTNVRARL